MVTLLKCYLAKLNSCQFLWRLLLIHVHAGQLSDQQFTKIANKCMFKTEFCQKKTVMISWTRSNIEKVDSTTDGKSYVIY